MAWIRMISAGALRSALVLALIPAAGCGSQPQTGQVVQESERTKSAREDAVKSAMEQGAYGPKYAKKAAAASPAGVEPSK